MIYSENEIQARYNECVSWERGQRIVKIPATWKWLKWIRFGLTISRIFVKPTIKIIIDALITAIDAEIAAREKPVEK